MLGESMKKIYYFIIAYILFVIASGVIIYNSFSPNKIGEIYSSIYNPLEYSIDTIKSDMDAITVSNDKWDWSKLKETKINDKQLKNTYNLLVSDIRTCYLLSNDLENKTYSNMKVMSFKNKKNITDKELSELNKNENCLESFDKYKTLTLSDDQKLSEKIKTQIGIITKHDSKNVGYRTFDELLIEDMTTMSQVASISKWLKVEYYSHIK
jgi:hypothetical protein